MVHKYSSKLFEISCENTYHNCINVLNHFYHFGSIFAFFNVQLHFFFIKNTPTHHSTRRKYNLFIFYSLSWVIFYQNLQKHCESLFFNWHGLGHENNIMWLYKVGDHIVLSKGEKINPKKLNCMLFATPYILNFYRNSMWIGESMIRWAH